MERIKKIATFIIKEEYRAPDIHNTAIVRVILQINYRAKTFSITPEKEGKNVFCFIDNSKEYAKWSAVIACIQNAIEFGNAEIAACRT